MSHEWVIGMEESEAVTCEHVLRAGQTLTVYRCRTGFVVGGKNNNSNSQLHIYLHRYRHPDLLHSKAEANFVMAPSSRQKRLIGFGNNYFYALGGTQEVSLNNDVLAWESGFQEEIEDIQCATTSTVFLTKSGNVYQVGMLHGIQWKIPTQIQIPISNRVDEIACGRHVCIARVGVAVVSWGAGHFGQLGQGPHVSHLKEPQIIRQLLPQSTGSPVVQLAAGAWHLCARTENGKVFAWGSNRRYQCGMKAPSTLVYPQPIDGNIAFTKIVCGKSHCIGLERNTAKVYTWGASAGCGHSSRKTSIAPPRLVEALQRVVIVDVAAGDAHSMALTGGGRVFSWGVGAEGQLGVGGPPPPLVPRPKLVGDLDFVAVAAGQQKTEKEQGVASQLANVPKITNVHCAGSYSMAVSSSGHLYTWGYNDGLVLGQPKPDQESLPLVEAPATHAIPTRILQGQTFDSRHNILLPKRVDGLADLKVELVAGGPNHLWVYGEVREVDEEVVVGKTLYEMQKARKSSSPTEVEELSKQSYEQLLSAAAASSFAIDDGSSAQIETTVPDRSRSSNPDGRNASGRALRSMSMSKIMKKLTPSRKSAGEEARPKLRKVLSAAFGSSK